MNKLLSLTKIQLKDLIGRSQRGINVKDNKLGKILQLFLLILLAVPAINFSLLTFKAFAELNQPELLITSMYVNSVLLMFLLGIPFLVSAFFYSRDLKFLTALPLREDTIVLAKLSTVYIYLLLITLLLMGPSLLVYIFNTGINLQVIILGLLALLLSPLLPLFISSLLILFIYRLLFRGNRRNFFAILSNLILLLGIIFIQLSISKYIASPESLQQAILSQEGLIGLVGMRFPPSIWLTRMIMGSFKDGFYFLLLNIALFWILQVLARFFFKKSLAAHMQDTAVGSGRIYYRQHSIGYQLVKRNLLIILKQPTFFLNTLSTLLVPIIMLAVFTVSGQFSLEMLKSPVLQPYLPLIFTGIIAAPAIMGSLSATAITREGQSFWETKVLPISAAANIRYRVLTTVLISLSGSALLLLISLFLFFLSIRVILVGVFFSLALTLFLSTVDIIIDIYRPLLKWTNPTAAVKNNLNVTISLGVRAGIALLVYLLYQLAPGLLMDFERALLGGGILFFLLYGGVRYYIYTYLDKVFLRISL